jgi:hypothetical protein
MHEKSPVTVLRGAPGSGIFECSAEDMIPHAGRHVEITAMGQKRAWRHVRIMSASCPHHVRFTTDSEHPADGLARPLCALSLLHPDNQEKKRLRPELPWKIDVIEQRRDQNANFVSEQ